MPKYKIQQSSTGLWLLIQLPDDYRDGDELPPPRSTDRYFDTEAEAITALEETMDADE